MTEVHTNYVILLELSWRINRK